MSRPAVCAHAPRKCAETGARPPGEAASTHRRLAAFGYAHRYGFQVTSQRCLSGSRKYPE